MKKFDVRTWIKNKNIPQCNREGEAEKYCFGERSYFLLYNGIAIHFHGKGTYSSRNLPSSESFWVELLKNMGIEL